MAHHSIGTYFKKGGFFFFMKKKIASSGSTVLFVAACWMAYSFSYIGRLNFSASMADMTSSGILLKSQAGAVTTGFFICYGCGQFLSGMLGDKINPRYLVFAGLTFSSLINFGISMGPPLWLMIVLWSMNGLSQSLLWAPICKIVSDRVSTARRQKACTALATTMAGMNNIQYIVWIIVTTKIEHTADKNGIEEDIVIHQEEDGEKVPHEEIPTNLWQLLCVSGLTILALVGGVQGVLKDCMSTWVPTFITDMFDLGSVISILTGTLLPIFGFFGPIFTNKIMMKTRDELSSLFILFVISAGCLAMLALFGRFSIVISIIALAVTYACSLGQNMILVGTLPMYFSKAGKVSTITGTMDAVCYLTTAVVSSITGVLVDNTGWTLVMTGWLVLTVLAAIGTLFAKRRWNKFRRNLF